MSLPTSQEHALRSPASSTETFTDAGLLHLAIGSASDSSRPQQPPPPWAAELSGSFAIIAEQLQNASRTIAAASSAPPTAAVAELTVRLDALEQAQERLAVELAALRNLHAGKSREDDDGDASGSLVVAHLERRLADALAVQKLDQDRLYARLHNSRASVSKMPIMALQTASGKPPPDHPKTKGEFEHLTKERYEGLLRAYNQPIAGDTDAKREALRIFLGLPV